MTTPVIEAKTAIQWMRDARAQAVRIVAEKLKPGTAVRFFDWAGNVRLGVIERQVDEFRFLVKSSYAMRTRRGSRRIQQISRLTNVDDFLDEEKEII
jgi:hypothetical protein